MLRGRCYVAQDPVGADLLFNLQANVPVRHQERMLMSWSNPDYDTALLLTQVTGNVTSPYARHVSEFVREYVDADGSQVWCVPPAASDGRLLSCCL